MEDINLHSIFCHLTRDDEFLSRVIETDSSTFDKGSKKKNSNMMHNMVSEYSILAPYEIQKYRSLPYKIKTFLPKGYYRVGIKNVVERVSGNINISFLNCLNFMIIPDMINLDLEDHLRHVATLENYITNMIQANFHIDKIKRSKKIIDINNTLISDLTEGKSTHELISYIVNIFEINLLVFDLSKMETFFYWTHGTKFPFLNLFKNIYAMCFIQGNYEPLLIDERILTEKLIREIYTKILVNQEEITCLMPIQMNIPTLIYLNTWKIDINLYLKIVEKFYPAKTKSICTKTSGSKSAKKRKKA